MDRTATRNTEARYISGVRVGVCDTSDYMVKVKKGQDRYSSRLNEQGTGSLVTNTAFTAV